MYPTELRKLAARVESVIELDAPSREQAVAALAEACDDAASGPPVTAETLESTDALLALAHLLLPGWTIAADGVAMEPNGHWRCTLRNSGVRDNDEYLGVGRGPTLPHALLSALLKVLAFRS